MTSQPAQDNTTTLDPESQNLLLDCQRWRVRYLSAKPWNQSKLTAERQTLLDRATLQALAISKQRGYQEVYASIDLIRSALTMDKNESWLAMWLPPPESDGDLHKILQYYRFVVAKAMVIRKLASAEPLRLDLAVARDEGAALVERYEWCPSVQMHTHRAVERDFRPPEHYPVHSVAGRDFLLMMTRVTKWFPANLAGLTGSDSQKEIWFKYMQAIVVEELCVTIGLQASALAAKALQKKLYGFKFFLQNQSGRARTSAKMCIEEISNCSNGPGSEEMVVR